LQVATKELSGFEGLPGFKELKEKPKNESMKDIEFLLKNNSEIFNITPPNTKAEDKLKPLKRYKLQPNDNSELRYRGFKTQFTESSLSSYQDSTRTFYSK
jgi:hypothetical protein